MDNLDTLIESLGLGYSAVFVPQSKSRNKDDKSPCLNWVIQISKGTHSSQKLETDYMQGIGHHPNYKQTYSFDTKHRISAIDQKEYVINAAETGKTFIKYIPSLCKFLEKDLPAPKLKDVLYSLVSDSDVLNYDSFESWAASLGFDADSRKAEKTYNDCMKIVLKLKSLIGYDKLEALKEAYQDY